MKMITLNLATILLLASAIEARLEYRLKCAHQEIGIRWPSYENSADYYVCQQEGGKQLKISCASGDLFSFVLQMCTSPSEYIPPPPRDALPTAAPIHAEPLPIPGDEAMHNIPGLLKPLIPSQQPHLPTMPHLPHLPNGPQPPNVDLPQIEGPGYVPELQPPSLPNQPILPVPPKIDETEIPSPPSPQMPQPPSIGKPPAIKPPMPPSSGSAQKPSPGAKPGIPLPPTPAPTPPLVKFTKAKPAAPTPPTPKKKVMPKVPVKPKKN